MKPKEEWRDEILRRCQPSSEYPVGRFCAGTMDPIIAAIQADARRSALEEAAKLLDPFPSGANLDPVARGIANRIRALAKNQEASRG